jgi:hypothetical protein
VLKVLNSHLDPVLMEMVPKKILPKLLVKKFSMELVIILKIKPNKFGISLIYLLKLKLKNSEPKKDLHTLPLKNISMTLKRKFGKVGCMLEISLKKKKDLSLLKCYMLIKLPEV